MNERICKELLTCACKLIYPNKSTSKVVNKYQRIISQAPYERFQTDTADLSNEIQSGIISGKVLGWTTNCVLLMVKDHFAKYLWSFLIPAKNAKSVARCLRTMFNDGHIPKMLHSDNGGEFKGEVKKLLSEYSIKHVKGRAYNPKCQGLSENSNRYVKKYLQLGYLTNNTEIFDISSSLQEITIGYNKRTHSVTRIEPEKAFFKPSKKLLLEIRQNTEKYYHSIFRQDLAPHLKFFKLNSLLDSKITSRVFNSFLECICVK